jgi:HNH endonuclease
MYCPYCGVTHDEELVDSSIEHVIPYGLGGSDELTITTCDRSNNVLGSNVDAPFMDFFPVRSKRFFLGLESTKGNEPTLDLGGTGWIDGQEVPISYLISAESNEFKIAEPKIVKRPNADGSEHWRVSGDPAKVREIIEGKLRKQMRLGKVMTLEDGSTLRLEDLGKLLAEKEVITQNPSVLKTILFDYLMPIRFFTKLALAMAHMHLGETFSRSVTGERFRHNMTAINLESVTVRGAIWPETDSVKRVLQLIAQEDHHMVAIMDGEPSVLLVSLFGEYGAFLPLGELAEGRCPTASGEGTIWRIELPSRKLSRFTMSALLRERSDEARRKQEKPSI